MTRSSNQPTLTPISYPHSQYHRLTITSQIRTAARFEMKSGNSSRADDAPDKRVGIELKDLLLSLSIPSLKTITPDSPAWASEQAHAISWVIEIGAIKEDFMKEEKWCLFHSFSSIASDYWTPDGRKKPAYPLFFPHLQRIHGYVASKQS